MDVHVELVCMVFFRVQNSGVGVSYMYCSLAIIEVMCLTSCYMNPVYSRILSAHDSCCQRATDGKFCYDIQGANFLTLVFW